MATVGSPDSLVQNVRSVDVEADFAASSVSSVSEARGLFVSPCALKMLLQALAQVSIHQN